MADEYRVRLVQDPPATGMAGWLEWLAKKRDALLVTGGLLYAFGYAAWSYYAWRDGLGLLPAIDSQYFIAGIVPTLIFLLAVIGIRLCWKHAGTKTPPFWLDAKAELKGWRLWVRTAIQFLLFATFMLLLVTGLRDNMRDNYPRATFILTNFVNGVVIASFLASIFFADPDTRQGHETWAQWMKRTLGRPILVAIISVLGVLAIFYYIDLLYTRLPQSLGGVKPRPAQLDLDREALSNDMLKALVSEAHLRPAPQQAAAAATGGGGAQPSPAPTPETPPKVVPSKTVEVLFSGNDVMVVRIDGRVYEIQRDIVKAVAWQK